MLAAAAASSGDAGLRELLLAPLPLAASAATPLTGLLTGASPEAAPLLAEVRLLLLPPLARLLLLVLLLAPLLLLPLFAPILLAGSIDGTSTGTGAGAVMSAGAELLAATAGPAAAAAARAALAAALAAAGLAYTRPGAATAALVDVAAPGAAAAVIPGCSRGCRNGCPSIGFNSCCCWTPAACCCVDMAANTPCAVSAAAGLLLMTLADDAETVLLLLGLGLDGLAGLWDAAVDTDSSKALDATPGSVSVAAPAAFSAGRRPLEGPASYAAAEGLGSVGVATLAGTSGNSCCCNDC